MLKLVLVNKGKGYPNTAAGNHHLCMLETAGKVLEKLSDMQFDFSVEGPQPTQSQL